MKAPPQVGDKVVVGDWHQFESRVSCIEEMPGQRTRLHITTTYPDDPFFKHREDTCMVWLHDEGSSWHRVNSYPHVN